MGLAVAVLFFPPVIPTIPLRQFPLFLVMNLRWKPLKERYFQTRFGGYEDSISLLRGRWSMSMGRWRGGIGGFASFIELGCQ